MADGNPIIENYSDYDALGLAELVRNKEVQACELVEEAIRRIEALNPKLNAVIYKTYDLARNSASGQLPQGPFTGVPYMLKELATMWQGLPTTNSCPYFKDFVAPLDLEIVTRVKNAGFVLVGKTNAPEFGWSITTEPAMYGPTHNPWDETVTPGGSSGGSAAAVAARILPLAEASDGAGSIRVPASNNGIVGLKPSRGTSTLAPLWADYWHGGAQFLCVSRSVRDTAAYLDTIYGTLPGDPYAAPRRLRSFLEESRQAPERLHIGFSITPPDGKPIHPEAVKAVESTAKLLTDLGHEVVEHDMSFDAENAWLTYTRMTAVATAAAFEAMVPFIGHKVTEAEVSPTMWSIIRRGWSINGPAHAADVDSLRLISREIASDLAKFDVFLTPTLTQPPRPLGYWDMNEPNHDVYNAKWSDAVFMFPFNISGQPAMSLPMHWTEEGLPMGVQIVGRNHDEATLLRLATQLEQAQPWINRRPPLSM